jgi:ParB family chromosome partitioning protein
MVSKRSGFIAAKAKERISEAGKRHTGNQYTGKMEGVMNSPQLPKDEAKTRTILAKQAGVSGQTYDALKKVVDHGTPELKEAVREKKIGAVTAAIISEMEPEEQVFIAALPKKDIKPHVAHNSGENEWYTPVDILEKARSLFGNIDLDPASCETANKNVQALKYYTSGEDGLAHIWSGKVWLNPPYSQPAISKFAEAVRLKRQEYKEALILVNNATETQWFVDMATHAMAFCFLSGRVKFIDKNGNKTGSPLQGQVLIYIGDNIEAFYSIFKGIGIVVEKYGER